MNEKMHIRLENCILDILITSNDGKFNIKIVDNINNDKFIVLNVDTTDVEIYEIIKKFVLKKYVLHEEVNEVE